MRKILPILMFILLCGCDKDSNNDLVYQEYRLPMNNGDLNLNIMEDEALVINDKASFQMLFVEYPNAESVDFNKYTLLLVKGTSTSGIEDIQKVISKTEDNKYTFAITIKRSAPTVMERWYLAYIIPKANKENITLTVTYNPSKEEH